MASSGHSRESDDADEPLKFDFGIICALPVEADAVDAIFDEHYDINRHRKWPGDPNVYTTGRIGHHRVVLVHMPDMGKVASATVSAHFRYSFDVKLVLLVGVCGGMPYVRSNDGQKQEILLGDIIISSSIIEYDFGRQFPNRFTKKRDLDTHHGPTGQEISGMLAQITISRVRDKLQRQTCQHLSKISCQDPGPSQDRLFKSSYRHKHHRQGFRSCKACHDKSSTGCEIAEAASCRDLQCDTKNLVSRQRHKTGDRTPIYHIGSIASGDTVMKSAEHRDELAGQGVIAFEMEGAGAWDNNNCIVIKGVCDYADSHKNKSWQPYAAATAAAFTKAFLELWPSKSRNGNNLPARSLGMSEAERSLHLNTLDFPERTHRELEIDDAYVDSCSWITEHQKYLEWNKARCGIFGVRGKPGSGKSTLMKKIFRQLKADRVDGDIILAYFYHRRGTDLQHSQIGMFRSLLYMLLHQCPSIQTDFWNASQLKQKSLDKIWRLEELREIFSSTLINASKHGVIRIFIDALDEAGDQAQKVISYFRDINEKLKRANAPTSICFSCRHFPIISVKEGYEICLEEHNGGDIATFVTIKLNQELQFEETTIEALRERLINRASGMFMWVSLVIPIIAQKYNDGEPLSSIYRVIESVPTDLGEVYRHILTEVIQKSIREETLHLMQWILLSEEPLSVRELRCALASDDSVVKLGQQSHQDSEGYIDTDERMKRWITSRTGGLAETHNHESDAYYKQKYQRRDTVQFIHQSVIDFLVEDKFHCLLAETRDGIAYGHHRLARSCINYLKWPKASQTAEHLTQQKQKLYPYDDETGEELTFAFYANRFWPLHAHKAEQGGLSQVDLVSKVQWPSKQFFTNCYTIKSCFEYYGSSMLENGQTLLHTASESSLTTVLSDLLMRGVQLEMSDSNGWRATHYAAKGGHEKIMQMLVDSKYDLTATTNEGESVLLVAASRGRLNIVHFLLDLNYATESPRDEILRSAMYAAANSGQAPVLEFLIAREADVNAQGGLHGNALQAAASRGSAECVKLLIDAGAEVNAQGGPDGNALQAAASRGSAECVKLLIDAGAEVNAQGGPDGNALQAAAWIGSAECVKLLIDAGAEVNAQGGLSGNALRAAASRGSAECVKLLIDAGAEVNAQGGPDGNALRAAASRGSAECVKLLIDAGAEVNAQGGLSGNALQAAASRGSAECVKLLIDAGAEVNAQGGPDGNALQAAASRGSAECVKLLIDAGAEVNAQGGPYGNALQAAASLGISIFLGDDADKSTWQEYNIFITTMQNCLNVLSILKDAHATISFQGGYFGSPLQAAARTGHVEVVQMLISWGLQVNTEGGVYGTALQAAAMSGSVEVVQVLLKDGALVNAQGGHFGNALQAAVIGGTVYSLSGTYDESGFILHEITYVEENEEKITRSLKLVKVLLDAGADVCASGGFFGSALQAAAHRGSREIFDFLYLAGAKLENQGGHYGNILQSAACGGCIPILETLLGFEIDVNTVGGYFGNALQAAAAASRNSEQSVKWLLEDGADVNATGGHFGTALQAAASRGSETTVKILLEAGADVNATGGHFGTALQAAAAAADEYYAEMVVKILLKAGADVNATGGHFGTALQAAASCGSETTVKILLEAGADVNATGGRFGTALQAAAAAAYKSETTVKILLEAGADVNATGGHFGTALQAAAANEYYSETIVKILLEAEADINAPGGYHGTGLRAAKTKNNLVAINMLRRAGAVEEMSLDKPAEVN